MIGGRTLARELALQLLFSSDVQTSERRDDADTSGIVEVGLGDAEASTEVKTFARELVYGMPYADWKAQNQNPATAEQLAAFEKSHG